MSRIVLVHLMDASIRSVLLALGAAAVLWPLSSKRSAAASHAAWTIVLCGMMLLFAVGPVLPPVPLRVLRAAPAPLVLVEATVLSEPLPRNHNPPAHTVSPAPSRLSPPDWRPVILLAYLAVVLTMMARLVLGSLLIRRLLASSTPVPDPKAPRLFESDAVSVPLTIGWLRPSILLPDSWSTWDAAKLEAVLAHESSHVARRDPLIAFLAGLNKCVFWFHPLAWFLERRLAALAEQACDEATLLLIGDRERYARLLLEMAGAVEAAECRVCWHAVAMARPLHIRHRVESIIDETRRASRGLTKGGWVTVLACSVPLVYGAAAVRLERRHAAPAPMGMVSSARPALPQPLLAQLTTPQAPAAQAFAVPPSRSDIELICKKGNWTAADAQIVELHLERNPDDLVARSGLINFYDFNGMRESCLKHVFWLIEHHPESQTTRVIRPDSSQYNSLLTDPMDYQRAKALWLEQADQRRSNDVQVLGNAADFFLFSDVEIAERLLKRAHLFDPSNQEWTERLASIYLVPLLSSLSPEQYPTYARPEFAARVKAEIDTSKDGQLLAALGALLGHLTVRVGENPATTPYRDFGDQLLERAKALGAQVPERDWFFVVQRDQLAGAGVTQVEGNRILVSGKILQLGIKLRTW